MLGKKMSVAIPLQSVLFFLLTMLSAMYESSASGIGANPPVVLEINAAQTKQMPKTLFGVFFEEINHAGAGGLWAELVNNRGFEAGGRNTPSNIAPWSIIGDESSISVSTDDSSPFPRNKIALRMDIFCDSSHCPQGGVGIYNPGFWGMNIEQGETYKLIFYARSLGPLDLSVSLTSSTGFQTLANANISASDITSWKRFETVLEAEGTDKNSRLQFTTTKKGVIWFDQVSLMPTDTYKGHGFRKDLFEMVKNLKPGFIRFPGGCFVEGDWLRNAFRWKETVGPWEERPGHFGDVWHYWTDDGFGHLEFLQLAEDLGAEPVWVFNNGISHNDEVDTTVVSPFVQEALDGIEFARGDPGSKWGSVRASMGRKEPFQLKYVAVGNEDCGKKNYLGNYFKFYDAIRNAYPDIKIITNCDGSSKPLDHPADMYDYHIYNSANGVYASSSKFDRVPRSGPKAFVSEYAVTGNDAGNGSLLAALAEAGFLIGIENNCDTVEMASYAPLFVNTNDRTWTPDAIVFDSSQAYGTPSYWMQHFFIESNGATLLNSTLKAANSSSSVIASAITYKDANDKQHLRIKVVNFGSNNASFQVSIKGLEPNYSIKSRKIVVLTSNDVMDENSFQAPDKVVPRSSDLDLDRQRMEAVIIPPHSFTSIDFFLLSTNSKFNKFVDLLLDWTGLD